MKFTSSVVVSSVDDGPFVEVLEVVVVIVVVVVSLIITIISNKKTATTTAEENLAKKKKNIFTSKKRLEIKVLINFRKTFYRKSTVFKINKKF